MLTIGRSLETEISQELPGVGGGATFNEYGISFWADENVLELHSGDGYITL